jgi:o-succinylbenzoate synthase
VKLRAARANPFTLRFTRPVVTARGAFIERPCVILELRDADGVRGYGEAAPWPGFGMETATESLAALRRIAPLLCDAELEPGEWPPAVAAQIHFAPAARAALDGALWDLAARRAGRPLAGHLAARISDTRGPQLEHVQVRALLVECTTEALRKEATTVRLAGYLAAKLKLGSGALAEDIARVRAARDGLGPHLALYGDANGAWNEQQAHAALAALAEFHLACIEQPVAADEIDALARLRRVATVPIAADESVATRRGMQRVIEAEAADIVVLKPASLGGPAAALEVAARAHRAGCRVVFTHTFESSVGARHALHCAAAWGDSAAVHGLATQGLFIRDLADPVACDRGVVTLSREPGLAITVADGLQTAARSA